MKLQQNEIYDLKERMVHLHIATYPQPMNELSNQRLQRQRYGQSHM